MSINLFCSLIKRCCNWVKKVITWLIKNRHQHYYPFGGNPNKYCIIQRENTMFQNLPYFWDFGTRGSDVIGMQISGSFLVTNNLTKTIYFTNAVLKGNQGYLTSMYGAQGICELPPGTCIKISVNFWIEPPLLKVKKKLKARVTFTDSLGKKHKSEKIEFRHIREEI